MTGVAVRAATGPAHTALPERVVHAALTWLDGHRSHFRLPGDATEPGVNPDATWKPLAELAQLSLAIGRLSEPGSHRRRLTRELVEFAWEETGRGDLLVALWRAEPHATHPAEFYPAFAESGLRNETFEGLVRLLTSTRGWRLTELTPTRALTVLHAERRLGLPPHADPEAVLRGTWLGGMPEPWTFEGRSGYALTHDVFHTTEWGSAPHALPGDLARYLTRWLPAWLDGCLEEERWDLAGELLATCACLPEPLAAGDEWRRYAEGQAATGAFADAGPVPVEESRETFLACYHPTLVAAFAGALATARAPAPSGRPTPAARSVPEGPGSPDGSRSPDPRRRTERDGHPRPAGRPAGNRTSTNGGQG